jgi:hypothetical protein
MDLAARLGVPRQPLTLELATTAADESLAEYAKIKGFQIASELTADVMGAKMHVTQEVIEIAELPRDDNRRGFGAAEHIFYLFIPHRPVDGQVQHACLFTGNIKQDQLHAVGKLDHENLVLLDAELH